MTKHSRREFLGTRGLAAHGAAGRRQSEQLASGFGV